MKIINRTTRKIFYWSAATIAALQMSAQAQTLVNRYSFNDTDNGTGNVGAQVADSVGGTNWNGILPNGGDLASAPGQLILSAANLQYVQLPSGILSNYTAVTIDVWATFPSLLPANCFLYGFGNTDAGGAGENYIFCQPENGRIAITGVDPGWEGEQGCGGAGDLSYQTVHVTSVYNPPAGYIQLYTNGVLVSQNTSITVPMSSVSSITNYIAKSLYTGDQAMDLQLDEFRIWNGALSSLQVAACDVAGPNTVSLNYGSVTNLQLSLPYLQLVQGSHESATVLGKATLLPNPADITLLSAFSTDKTNILNVSSNGMIQAVGQGSANVIVSYGGISATQVVTVVQPASVLMHRYALTTDASDSINPGGTWDGTLPNGGTFDGTQVQLQAAGLEYVQLPAGVTSNYTAISIEAWATFPDTLPGACFFFGFGNTDAGGAGENYVYMQPSSGHIGIGGNDPGWSGEQDAGTYGNLSTHTNIHIVAVFNPAAGWEAVYTNGVLAGKNTAVTWPLTSISSELNYIGRSLFNGDSYMDVNVHEFRIYNGALTSQGIAISDAAGPNTIPSGVTNGPGALLSFSLQAPTTLEMLQAGLLKFYANYASLTNFDLINNSVLPPAGLSIVSGDTNILVYGSDSKLHGVNPGTTTISVIYQGVTNKATITVTAPTATLAHRYSFQDADDGSGNYGALIADSVGGTNWDGTLPSGGTLTGTNLQLVSASQQYVQLPGGILSNYTAVTIEGWVTSGTLANNCFYFGFGDTDATTGLGADYIFGSLVRQYIAITGADPGYPAEQGTAGGANLSNQSVHFVAVYDPPAGYVALYTNGVLQSINNAVTTPMSAVNDVYSYIGKSLYSTDPYPDMTLTEFRIYDGALTPAQVSLTQQLGPTQLLSTGGGVSLTASVQGNNLVMTWPSSATGYTLVASSSLIGGTWSSSGLPTPTLNGSVYQVTVSKTTGTQFFRLAK